MTLILGIVHFLENLLGQSAFIDATHKLLTDVGAQSSIDTYDRAVATAERLLTDGASLAATIQQVSQLHPMPESHAAVVSAVAVHSLAAKAVAGQQ